MSTSPTQRTIRELKNQGRKCAIVEKWNQHAGPYGIRQDMFGIIDVIALDPERGVVGVQSCGQNFSEHVRKFLDERAEECIDWLSTPGTVLELWGWRKVKIKRGGKAERWQPRIREFTLADFGLPLRDGVREGQAPTDSPSPGPEPVGAAPPSQTRLTV